jgi:hypothetical protein
MPGSPTDAGRAGPVAVAASDYLWFVDLALRQMVAIVEGLGDEWANRRPPLAGANTPFAILTHCLGVMEYWGGATVAGRAIQRDRAAEFTARGEVAVLLRRTEEARCRLREDVAGLDTTAVPVGVQPNPDDPIPYGDSKGAVLLHILEELFQHLGQMELTRDMLRSEQ